ncbi:hypothetical protein ACFQ07_01675 [Actinomadura adrarensis]|uniref:Uncharacterized protein n=1 Tax=Actinomadura adrarensis TaxID=1819600 RepID=A0ABW3CB53_9ACTN
MAGMTVGQVVTQVVHRPADQRMQLVKAVGLARIPQDLSQPPLDDPRDHHRLLVQSLLLQRGELAVLAVTVTLPASAVAVQEPTAIGVRGPTVHGRPSTDLSDGRRLPRRLGSDYLRTGHVALCPAVAI